VVSNNPFWSRQDFYFFSSKHLCSDQDRNFLFPNLGMTLVKHSDFKDNLHLKTLEMFLGNPFYWFLVTAHEDVLS
jgi:hypothetical protein